MDSTVEFDEFHSLHNFLTIRTSLQVTFKNEQTLEYQFYYVQFKATSPGVMAVIKLSTPVRQSVSESLTVSNPLQTPVTFQLNCSVQDISFPPQRTVPPQSEVNINSLVCYFEAFIFILLGFPRFPIVSRQSYSHFSFYCLSRGIELYENPFVFEKNPQKYIKILSFLKSRTLFGKNAAPLTVRIVINNEFCCIGHRVIEVINNIDSNLFYFFVAATNHL